MVKTRTYRWMPTEMGTYSEHSRNPDPDSECANRCLPQRENSQLLAESRPEGLRDTSHPHMHADPDTLS